VAEGLFASFFLSGRRPRRGIGFQPCAA